MNKYIIKTFHIKHISLCLMLLFNIDAFSQYTLIPDEKF